MEQIEKKLLEINREFASYHVPRYRELPDIDLYMDQVLAYLNNKMELFMRGGDENIITPSMINNYVKSEIVPTPVGKKYTRRHLAYIIVVYFFKQVLKMNSIKDIITHHVNNSDEEKAYEMFCNELEDAFRSCISESGLNSGRTSDIGSVSIRHSAIAIANKIYVQKIVDEMHVEPATDENRKSDKKPESRQEIKQAKKQQKKAGTKLAEPEKASPSGQ